MSVVVPAVDPADVLAIAILLPTLSTLAFAGRVYDRKVRRRVRLEKDDWALCVSLFGLWSLAIICMVGVGIGAMGMHSKRPQPGDKAIWTIHRDQADEDMEKIVQVYSFIEKFTFFFYKASVCFAYRRIFPYATLQRIAYVVLVILVLQLVAFLIATGMQCGLRNWGVWYQEWALEQHCAQAELVWVGYTVSDVCIDLFLLFVPMFWLVKMQLPKAKKISAIIIFALGGLSVTVGIARMSYLLAFTYTGTKGYRDLMGLQSTMLVWSLTECAVAIIASNISALRNLIFRDRWGNTKEYWRRFSSSNDEKRKNSSGLLGSELSDENRYSERRRLRDRSRSVGPGGRDRSYSAGPPLIQGIQDLELGPTQYGRKDSWA